MTPNAYGPRHAEVWLVAVSAQDLAFEFVDSSRIGVEPPRWTLREVPAQPAGPVLDGLSTKWAPPQFAVLETVGPAAWLKGFLDEDGWDAFLLDGPDYGLEGRERFLLGHGIAPGQPFKVRASMPTTTRDYWGEYDVDIELAAVLEVAPWPKIRSAKAWCLHMTPEWRGEDLALFERVDAYCSRDVFRLGPTSPRYYVHRLTRVVMTYEYRARPSGHKYGVTSRTS